MDRFQRQRPTSSYSVANESTYSHGSRTMLKPLGPSPVLLDSTAPRKSADSRRNSISLSQHYLPHKLPSNIRRRNSQGGPVVPKRGGGTAAFRSGEARVADEKDEEFDGINGPMFSKKKLRWNHFKLSLALANSFLTGYSLVALVFCLLTHLNVWTRADIIRVGNRSELIVSTVAASFCFLTSLIGWSGILLNNRSFLAVYTFFLWIGFAMLVVPGYLSYRRRFFNLEGKINAEWSRLYGSTGRQRIQNQLGCCGYFSPFVEATVTQTCYARSILPGCKKPYLDFQKVVLTRWYIVTFSLVPLHIAIIITGLLCSNHITFRFGKGLMPKAYRLSMESMAIIIENYAMQLADQYGTGVASEVLARSRSNLQLDSIPAVTYNTNNRLAPPSAFPRYDSLGGRAPPEGGY